MRIVRGLGMNLEGMLRQKFWEYDGNQFQKLFYEIMRAKYGADFDMPQPFGSLGDYKCDGYLNSSGTFYACYGPELINDSTAEKIKSKLRGDVRGLVKNIKDGKWLKPLNKFVFVLNLRNENYPPLPVCVEKQNLEEELFTEFSRTIPIEVITQYDLSVAFNTLTVNEQKYILEKAFINDPVFDFDGSIIAKIIEHFATHNTVKARLHEIMKFESKIIFNNLNEERSAELGQASYSNAALQNYLEKLGEDACGILQSAILELYRKSCDEFPDDSNLQYDYIKSNLYLINDSTVSVKLINDSKAIIMSYFFENCTIFKSE